MYDVPGIIVQVTSNHCGKNVLCKYPRFMATLVTILRLSLYYVAVIFSEIQDLYTERIAVIRRRVTSLPNDKILDVTN